MSEDSAAVPAPVSSPEAEPTFALEAGGTPAFAPYTAPYTAHESPREADALRPKPTRRRLRWLWWTAGSLAVASLAGLCVYLAVVAHEWSNRVDDLTAISQDLGTQVADQTAARKTAEAHAAVLQSQLDTATTRISTLANDEANAVDHEAVWINLVDSMVTCADQRQRVIDAYIQGTGFRGLSNAGYAAEITTYCNGIKNDYTNFKAEIGK
ncbi:hypothetical protein [Demequina lutea]|uniref:Uncharacterized protein n=1 Tax=Demequina lutea TaxID=431489 RepID=A0A7Y9ZBE5_9MICO|nr:hypothetical protein [Demequina lutea]NYI41735.1 hypothetical protein [Demequina lutea]